MVRLNTLWLSSPHFQGAFWKITSFLCFAAINGIVRHLAQVSQASNAPGLPAYEIAFFQDLLGLIFLLPWILQQNLLSLRTKRIDLQVYRILFSAMGVVLWYTSLAFLPLAQAVALMFLGPILTTIGAKLFLKETIGLERGIAILIGLLGGLVISHSTASSPNFLGWLAIGLPVLLPVLAAAAFSGANLLIRKIVNYDSPQLTVVYLLIFMAPVLAIPTFIWGIWPAAWQWPWLLTMGGLAAAAHLCLSRAYAVAEVSYLIPYGFTKWFASALIGIIVFQEIPSFWTCLGTFTLMGIIIFLSYLEVRNHQRQTQSYKKLQVV